MGFETSTGNGPARNNNMGGKECLEMALAYRRVGLSVIPIRTDGSKAPAIKEWKPYQIQMASEEEVRKWYSTGSYGVAVLGGRVSGNLECIDFDREAEIIFPEWCALMEGEAPGLIARLSVARTPKPGFHVRYRCPEVAIPGNTKLAVNPAQLPRDRVLIESRGEGGYALAPGCPPACHETRRLYAHHSGPLLTQVQTITAAEREIIIRCARSFDRTLAEEATFTGTTANNGDLQRPGDDYNRRGPDWTSILEPHGWIKARQRDRTTYWRRPGKDNGWSATTGYCTSKEGLELFACFSSNAHPFEGGNGAGPSCYSKFAAYALLSHGGDFKAAAKTLAKEGYGNHSSSKDDRRGGQTFLVGPLTLRPGGPRQTPSGKIQFPLVIMRGGIVVDQFSLSSSLGSRREVVRVLKQHLGGSFSEKEINDVLAAVISAAAQSVVRQARSEDPRLSDIVTAKVSAAFRLVYRTERGAWSEARGCDITRGEFVTFTPSWLLDAAAEAVDAARDSHLVSRSALLSAVKCELEVLWADLMSRLPSAPPADLTQDSAASKRFREAMVRLWTAMKTWEVPRAADGNGRENFASAASLVSRVKSQLRDRLRTRTNRPRWQNVHPAVSAWWRVHVLPDGQEVVLLAMRWELVSQIRQELPGVHDQLSLTTLGTLFGVLEPKPEVPTVLSGGKARLAVLSQALTVELLEEPGEWEEESQ